MKPGSAEVSMNQSWRVRLGIGVFLVAITWVVFGQTFQHQFINYDDPLYVYDNPHVRAGLSWRGIGWAFTHVHSQNWHPLTTISHMLDCQVFGVNPGPHHLVNVLLHSVAAALLFILLVQMTGHTWLSGFATAIFAIHPLRVESVAWIAERKDVLSGVFFMLTLIAYGKYAESIVQSPESKVAEAVTSDECRVTRPKHGPRSTLLSRRSQTQADHA